MTENKEFKEAIKRIYREVEEIDQIRKQIEENKKKLLRE